MEVDLHIHSHYSNDSRSKTKLIVRRATELGLGAIAVTDHNSWRGAREAEQIAAGSILVVPGAEIKTEKGDLLALFVKDEITSRDFVTVIEEIGANGGVSIVPHPGDSPRITKEDLRLADGLEAFNSTCSRSSNDRSARTCKELGKPAFGSSDAHMVMEIGNGRTEVAQCSSLAELREVLLKTPVVSKTVRSNPLIHRMNATVNFGLKGIWRS